MSKTRKDAIEALQSIGWTVEDIVEALGTQSVIYNQLPQTQPMIEAKGFWINKVRGAFIEYHTVESGQGFNPQKAIAEMEAQTKPEDYCQWNY